MKGFEYLFTFALIYKNSIWENFNELESSNYKNLAPIINLNTLISNFSRLYDIEYNIADKIINLYIFDYKRKDDLFAQPLVKIDQEKLLFCPTLILQVNLIRSIELLVSKWGKKIDEKGHKFEKELRAILSFNPHLEINTNKIEFEASDKKNIEYDFLCLFNNTLLLMEFKNLKAPFSDKEKKEAFKEIKIAINQVNRREKIVHTDWDKIKKLCSFTLPEIPPANIIKLACTNLLDFSFIESGDVKIIDSSSIIKFFMSPHIKMKIFGDTFKERSSLSLWKGNYPTVDEFVDFLKSPKTVEPYLQNLKSKYRPIAKITEDDYNILFLDMFLSKYPFKDLAEDFVYIDVGRNDPCPCGSGKKHKKCCMR